MCHLILSMPLIALPIFWLLPPEFSVPIYALIVLVSGLLYRQITHSMKRPVTTGAEILPGTKAEVISKSSPGGSAKYIVRAGGELWTANGGAGLQPGQMVNILAVKGIKLMIEPDTGKAGDAENKGVKVDERHCH